MFVSPTMTHPGLEFPSQKVKPPLRCWTPRVKSLLNPQLITCGTQLYPSSPNHPPDLRYSIFRGAKLGHLDPVSFPKLPWKSARAEVVPAAHTAWSRKGTSPSKHPLQHVFHNNAVPRSKRKKVTPVLWSFPSQQNWSCLPIATLVSPLSSHALIKPLCKFNNKHSLWARQNNINSLIAFLFCLFVGDFWGFFFV